MLKLYCFIMLNYLLIQGHMALKINFIIKKNIIY